MIVIFEPTGSQVVYPLVTPVNTSTEPITLPILSMNFGGVITNADATPPGSLRAFGASNGKGILSWQNALSNSTKNFWQLDDRTAVDTAIQTILTAYAGDETQVIIKSDGSAGS